MRATLAFCALVLLSSAAGCATSYSYLPVSGGGGPAARYPIPPGVPQGEVFVTSFGLTDLDVAPGQPGRMLHVRVAVSNNSASPWAVDGRQQLLEAPGVAPQTAAFLNTDAGQGPVYEVLPGRANVFDLYYAVPPPLNQESQLVGFAMDWRVDVPGQSIAQQTPFQRTAGPTPSYDPYPPYVVVGLGFGVGWWYGPGYGYRHPPYIRHYYYYPQRSVGGPWRGPPPRSWRGTPPGAGGWRGAPPPSGGGWRGAPPPSGGGWRGAPPPSGGGWRGSPAPRSAPAPRGGGWRGRP